MAKPTKYATLICIGLSILAAVGIVVGILLSKSSPRMAPLITIFCLLPTVIYEVYRTEGKFTKLASWGLLVVLIAEVILIAGNISIDLAALFGKSKTELAGHTVPLGDIRVFGPLIIAALSAILFYRTSGIYTRWLAVIIFITSFPIIYALNPAIFVQFLSLGGQ